MDGRKSIQVCQHSVFRKLQTSKHMKTTGLLGLPNELLTEIGEFLYANERYERHRCKKFTATWVLTRVSRRLRSIILPIIFRELSFKTLDGFIKHTSEKFTLDSKHQNLAFAVRSIRIRPTLRLFYTWPLPPAGDDSFELPFLNLEEFDCTCTKAMLGGQIVLGLSRCIHLKALTMVCNDSWPMKILSQLSSLKTIRLYVDNFSEDVDTTGFASKLMSYTSITTLALHVPFGAQAPILLNECLTRCCFPNLQAFTARSWLSPLLSVFQFIHQHPSLLEVNVDTSNRKVVRIEPLLKLIDGTGTWFNPPDNEGTSKLRLRSHYDGDSISITDNMRNPGLPSLIPDCYITCSSFAFTRTSIDPHLPLWKSRSGSRSPRYKCTALALATLSITHEDTDSRMIRALREMSRAMPDLEELRLQIHSRGDLARRMTWVEELTLNSLVFLPQLRRLTICWVSIQVNYKPRWARREYLATFGSSFDPEDNYIPFLDDAVLPLYMTLEEEYQIPTTLHHLALAMEEERVRDPYRATPPGMFDKAVEGIRSVLQIPDEEELDIYDKSLPMRAWEARNEKSASDVVRQIASMCPALETFDWYFFNGDYDSLPNTVVWSWYIRRAPERIRGDLKYVGCLKGDPPPLYPYVGQELQYALKYGYMY